jgi:hypothetical protein
MPKNVDIPIVGSNLEALVTDAVPPVENFLHLVSAR